VGLLALLPFTAACSPAGWRVFEATAAVTAALADLAALVPPAPPPPPPDGTAAICDGTQCAPREQSQAYAPKPSTLTVPCGECVIDDLVDANNQVIVDDGRDGYWYTFVDKVGTTISPPAGRPFILSRGGAHGLQYAAHMLGKVSSSGAPQYAAMGFNFTNPRAAYDASKYTGVSFYAKIGAGSQTRVRLSVPDLNTDPQGHVCTVCSNDFGVELELTDQWQKFAIGFAQMGQLEGWGSPQRDQIDTANVYGMQWGVNAPGASYDVWVSDVRFSPYEELGQPL
jgi:endoglucanase